MSLLSLDRARSRPPHHPGREGCCQPRARAVLRFRWTALAVAAHGSLVVSATARVRPAAGTLVAVGLGGLWLLLRRLPLLPELGNATPGDLDRLADLPQGLVDVVHRRTPVSLVGGVSRLQVVPRDLELLLGGEHLVVPAGAGGPHGEEQGGGGERNPGRSEERRVGKECRSRGSREQEKTNQREE